MRCMYEGKLACRSEVTSYACGEQMIGEDPRSMDNRVLPDMTCWIEIPCNQLHNNSFDLNRPLKSDF